MPVGNFHNRRPELTPGMFQAVLLLRNLLPRTSRAPWPMHVLRPPLATVCFALAILPTCCWLRSESRLCWTLGDGQNRVYSKA